MAIKSGQILHDAQGFVIDRIQSGGASALNIPEEKIYELGNYSSVATVRDIPELTFEVESTDMSCEIEALLTAADPNAIVDGQEFDFQDQVPLDIISPFKSRYGAYDIVKGIAIPYLTLENATYRFGVRANSTQTFTLRGDSVYYIPGTPKFQEFTLVDNTLTYSLSDTALTYMESGNTLYVLSACVKNPTTKAYRRLFYSTTAADGYTNTSTSITLNTDWFDTGYTKLHVTWGTATAATYNATVHPSATVKPAAVRSKDICLYVSDGAATPTLVKWSGVQSFEATRAVTLENDEEFCNSKYVSIDYDVPTVSGTVGIKPYDPADLWSKIQQVANVPSGEIAGPFSSQPLEVECQIKHPDTGAVLKTLYIPDARFTIPNVQGRVQTKLEVTFNWSSDTGLFYVYNGLRP